MSPINGNQMLALREAVADIDEMIRLAQIWDTKGGKLAAVMNHMQNKLRKTRMAIGDATGSNIPPPPDNRK